jgi:hypothetical protein
MNTTEEEKEKLKKSIFMQFSNVDLLSNLPSCDCGEIKGEYALGVVCTNCNTPVVSSLEQSIEPLLWMRSPNGVGKLMNPIVWTMLKDRFTIASFNVIQWLCDTTYRPGVREPQCLYEIEAAGIIRGYNNFVENFDGIIEFLYNIKQFKNKKRNQREYLQELIHTQRDCIFSKFIPLPNKSLLVIEDNSLGTYVDPIIIGAIDAIQTIASIDNSMSQMSIRVKENRTIKSIIKLSEFSDNYYKESLAKKGGVFRKHVYGSRSYFSFRAVISSITEPHEYDEIHIPWPIAVTALRIHLMNRMFKDGYSLNDAIGYLHAHTNKYSEYLDKIFDDLISQSPQKGLPCITQRNPSLERGSAQLTRITKIRKDPHIPTVGISILIVKGLNADQI